MAQVGFSRRDFQRLISSIFLSVWMKTSASCALLLMLSNAIITFHKLNYKVEYIVAAIGLGLLVALRFVLASKSTVKQVVKATKKKVEKKTE